VHALRGVSIEIHRGEFVAIIGQLRDQEGSRPTKAEPGTERSTLLTNFTCQVCTDLNSVCYNSLTEQGQMFWIAATRGRYGSQFDVLSMLSISPGIQIDPVETVETGETVDSKNRQQTCGFGANRMKSKWGT